MTSIQHLWNLWTLKTTLRVCWKRLFFVHKTFNQRLFNVTWMLWTTDELLKQQLYLNAPPCFKNASHSKLLNSNYSHCNAIIWKWKCLENVYHHDLVKSRPRSNRIRGAPKKTLLLLYAKQFFCIHKLWLYRCKHDKKRINTHL